MDRARDGSRNGGAVGSRVDGGSAGKAGTAKRSRPAKAGLWSRAAKWVNLAWLVSFLLYVASGYALFRAGLLTPETSPADPPILLWPTMTLTAVLILAQLAVNAFDALVRLWDEEVGVISIGLVLLGPCTGGTSSFLYWLFVGRRSFDDRPAEG
jgi:hypothetical protein